MKTGRKIPLQLYYQLNLFANTHVTSKVPYPIVFELAMMLLNPSAMKKHTFPQEQPEIPEQPEEKPEIKQPHDPGEPHSPEEDNPHVPNEVPQQPPAPPENPGVAPSTPN
jgi:hypothetical protein